MLTLVTLWLKLIAMHKRLLLKVAKSLNMTNLLWQPVHIHLFLLYQVTINLIV